MRDDDDDDDNHHLNIVVVVTMINRFHLGLEIAKLVSSDLPPPPLPKILIVIMTA